MDQLLFAKKSSATKSTVHYISGKGAIIQKYLCSFHATSHHYRGKATQRKCPRRTGNNVGYLDIPFFRQIKLQELMNGHLTPSLSGNY